MSIIEKTGQKGTLAVKRLREHKLRNGLPFMINTKELATNQCYLEYPNGIIKLVTIAKSANGLDIIRELTATEAQHLRRRFHFSSIK